MQKQDRQGVRTAQDLERKYKFGQYEKLIKELNDEVNALKNNTSTSEVITKTISIFLEPGDEELQTTGNHVNGSEIIPDDKIPLYDFDNNGVVDMTDHFMCGFAGAGFSTLASWSGAVKSDVTITIDMSTPEKIVSAKGTNMWGREVELTSSELIADMLLDIDFLKSQSGEATEDGESSDISELQIQVESIISELSLKADKNEVLEDNIEQNERITGVDQTARAAAVRSVENETAIASLISQVDNLESNVATLTSYDGTLQEQITSLRGEITEAKTLADENSWDINELKSSVNILQEDVGYLQSYKNIIASGVDSYWNYEKYSDATAKCWRKITPTSVTFTKLFDGHYYALKTVNFPSGLFSETPTYIYVVPITENTNIFPNAYVSSASATNVDVGIGVASKTNTTYYNVGFYIEATGNCGGIG